MGLLIPSKQQTVYSVISLSFWFVPANACNFCWVRMKQYVSKHSRLVNLKQQMNISKIKVVRCAIKYHILITISVTPVLCAHSNYDLCWHCYSEHNNVSGINYRSNWSCSVSMTKTSSRRRWIIPYGTGSIRFYMMKVKPYLGKVLLKGLQSAHFLTLTQSDKPW